MRADLACLAGTVTARLLIDGYLRVEAQSVPCRDDFCLLYVEQRIRGQRAEVTVTLTACDVYRRPLAEAVVERVAAVRAEFEALSRFGRERDGA